MDMEFSETKCESGCTHKKNCRPLTNPKLHMIEFIFYFFAKYLNACRLVKCVCRVTLKNSGYILENLIVSLPKGKLVKTEDHKGPCCSFPCPALMLGQVVEEELGTREGGNGEVVGVKKFRYSL